MTTLAISCTPNEIIHDAFVTWVSRFPEQKIWLVTLYQNPPTLGFSAKKCLNIVTLSDVHKLQTPDMTYVKKRSFRMKILSV